MSSTYNKMYYNTKGDPAHAGKKIRAHKKLALGMKVQVRCPSAEAGKGSYGSKRKY